MDLLTPVFITPALFLTVVLGLAVPALLTRAN
jgi:hypothetical protein